MQDYSIKVENVHKHFLLPHEKRDSLKRAFVGILRLKRGRPEVQRALQNITFDIRKGEFFGIVGRNGSGKSTLLKLLAGIYQPSQGKITIDGKLVPFIELGVGFNGELTGRENVYLNGALLGFSKREIDGQYDDIVRFAELERFMDQKLKNYSSGMQVRLAFSLATRAQADILLVDEVLAVGDAAFQRKCFDHFRLLKKNKKTVVFVTHDMNAVREYCDRAMLIEKSEVVSIGKPYEIASQYTRLFNDTGKDDGKARADKRWGDRDLEFKEVKITPNRLTRDKKTLTIVATIKANKDTEGPVVGFAIKNQSGGHLLGTNSQIQRLHIGEVKKGATVKIEWELGNIFNEGVYHVDLALVGRDSITTHDWWEDAAGFDVISEDRVPYPINPPVEMRLL